MERASRSQQKLLEFIENFIKEHSFGPSYREIMRALGYQSVSTVATHVNGLVAKGLLRKRGRSARSLELTHGQVTLSASKPSSEEAWLESELRRFARSGASDRQLQTLAEACQLLGFAKTQATVESFMKSGKNNKN